MNGPISSRPNFSANAGLIGGILLVGALALSAVLLPVDRRLPMEICLVLAMAQGWNLLCGYTGLLSFGHQAFIGVGAYTLFLVVNTLGISPFLGLAFSAVVSAAVAVVIALLLKGSRDAYFSIGIWVLADCLRLLVGQWDFVGSSQGMVLNAPDIDPATFGDAVFWAALALVLVTQFAVFGLLRTRFGLGLMAIRDNETAAASVGIAPGRSRVIAFVASAVICAVAGAIYYLSVLYVDPAGAFDIDWQIRILFIVIVGGAGTLEGPLIGTAIYFLLREFLQDHGGLFLIVQGAIAALTMLFAPQGLWGLIQARTGWQLFPTKWVTQ
jgi:branched-chain amino acid transport system permease protein